MMGRPKVRKEELRERHSIRIENRLWKWARKKAPKGVGDFINNLLLREYEREKKRSGKK